jgi:hypothetical protein
MLCSTETVVKALLKTSVIVMRAQGSVSEVMKLESEVVLHVTFLFCYTSA